MWVFASGLVSGSAVGQTVTVSVEPANAAAQAGEPVTFTFWIRTDGGTVDLRGYQIGVPCLLPGGSGGVVGSAVLTIDQSHAAWVMDLDPCGGSCGFDDESGNCPDPDWPPLAFYIGWEDTDFAATVNGVPHYLAEVTYQVSGDAQSGEVFTMAPLDPGVEEGRISFLRRPGGGSVGIEATWEGATLQIGGDCPAPRPYADVTPFGSIVPPCPGYIAELGDGFANMLDVFCTFAGFNEGSPYTLCPCGDISPCAGDGFVNMLDVFAAFAAFNGEAYCPAPCP